MQQAVTRQLVQVWCLGSQKRSKSFKRQKSVLPNTCKQGTDTYLQPSPIIVNLCCLALVHLHLLLGVLQLLLQGDHLLTLCVTSPHHTL